MGVDINHLMGQVITDPNSDQTEKKNISTLLFLFINALVNEQKKKEPLDSAQLSCDDQALKEAL